MTYVAGAFSSRRAPRALFSQPTPLLNAFPRGATTVTLTLLLLVLVGVGWSQTDPAAGIPMFSAQLPGGLYESINPATSNIYVQIPVRSKSGKIPISYWLAMNSHAYPYWTLPHPGSNRRGSN